MTVIERRPARAVIGWTPIRSFVCIALRVLRGELAGARRGPYRRGRRERRLSTNERPARRSARTLPRRPRGSPRRDGSACCPATSIWVPGATVSRSETWTGELHDVRSVAGGRRSLSRGVDPGHPYRPVRCGIGRPGRCRQRPAGDRRSASSYAVLGSGRRRRTRVSGFWITGWSRIGFAGSGPATRGFMTAGISSRWSRSASIMEGISLDAEAGAQAANLDELFERLESSGRLVRIDPSMPATMFRGTMLSPRELEALRQIDGRRAARPSAAYRGRPNRARAWGDRNRHRRPARRLYGAWLEQRPRHADFPAPADRASAGAVPIATVSTQH